MLFMKHMLDLILSGQEKIQKNYLSFENVLEKGITAKKNNVNQN